MFGASRVLGCNRSGLSGKVQEAGVLSTAAVGTAPYRLANGERMREQDGFDAFVRAHLPRLLAFGRVLTGSDDAAADLVQDALERALLHWARIESRESAEGYVRRIMVNRNISLWRRFRRETITDRVPEQPVDAAFGDGRGGPAWAAIQALPPRQRAVIALRYYEDLSEAEIARVLGCSVGTVKSQASRAMRKLRQRLVPHEEVH